MWSEELQGIILGVFFWGYAATHIPGGILSERYGGKYILSFGILSTAIFTLLTPVCIVWGGAPLLITLRVLEGIGEGSTFPALNTLIAAWILKKGESYLIFQKDQRFCISVRWSPSKFISYWSTVERIRFKLFFILLSFKIGNILSNMISGVLLDAFDGWETPFYFFGSMGFIWVICFQFLCYKDPKSYPFITEKEKEYLLKELKKLERDKTLPSTPWKSILTSVPMIALVVAQVSCNQNDFKFL